MSELMTMGGRKPGRKLFGKEIEASFDQSDCIWDKSPSSFSLPSSFSDSGRWLSSNLEN